MVFWHIYVVSIKYKQTFRKNVKYNSDHHEASINYIDIILKTKIGPVKVKMGFIKYRWSKVILGHNFLQSLLLETHIKIPLLFSNNPLLLFYSIRNGFSKWVFKSGIVENYGLKEQNRLTRKIWLRRIFFLKFRE